jgi:hypothetical protein
MIYVQNNICNFVYDGNLIFFPRYWQYFQADDDIATVKRKTINILGSKKCVYTFFSRLTDKETFQGFSR